MSADALLVAIDWDESAVVGLWDESVEVSVPGGVVERLAERLGALALPTRTAMVLPVVGDASLVALVRCGNNGPGWALTREGAERGLWHGDVLSLVGGTHVRISEEGGDRGPIY